VSDTQKSLNEWLESAGDTLFDRASSMATRGTIYYAFSKSVKHSVFSSETHLTWRLLLSRPNSQEWWKVQSAKIRISISLGYAAILGRLRFSTPEDWDDIEFDSQS
jgi:hypothetical protein